MAFVKKLEIKSEKITIYSCLYCDNDSRSAAVITSCRNECFEDAKADYYDGLRDEAKSERARNEPIGVTE